jgi:hypothetical protein
MNTLARVVHDIVTGEDSAPSSCLSPLEQAALADLRSLLRQSPQKMDAFLARAQDPIDWYAPGRRPATIPDADSGN